MSGKKSSFHMSNEFNGKGEKTYLTATEYNSYEPLSQENVRLTPDFSQAIPKALGGMSVVINPNAANQLLLKALGGIAVANQVIIGKDVKTGEYTFRYQVSSLNEFTNDSNLLASSRSETTAEDEDSISGWIQVNNGWMWLQKKGGYIKEGWHKANGKWYYFINYLMVTGWHEILYEDITSWYYFKSSKDSGGVERAGHMATGWLEIEWDGELQWFYFRGTGRMVASDWVPSSGKWYYLRSNGVMQKSSLREWKGKLYFLKDDGSMAVSETITDPASGKTYHANADGVLSENIGLRDKIIEAAEWYLNGCDSNVHAEYSMDFRGKRPDGVIDKTLQPWVAYTYLDCSAYVGVVYTSAGIEGFSGNGTENYINTGTLREASRTYKIERDELLPGDLVFRNNKGTGGDNHVGIFAYFDSNNQIIAYDCASSVNGIRKRARPDIWDSSESLYYRYVGF